MATEIAYAKLAALAAGAEIARKGMSGPPEIPPPPGRKREKATIAYDNQIGVLFCPLSHPELPSGELSPGCRRIPIAVRRNADAAAV